MDILNFHLASTWKQKAQPIFFKSVEIDSGVKGILYGCALFPNSIGAIVNWVSLGKGTSDFHGTTLVK